MQLQTKSFSGLLQDMAAATQGTAGTSMDFSPGSVIRSLCEAVAGVFLWLQYSALQILSITRAATSTGSDLDSWMADFSFSRLPATTAVGSLTFGRYTAGAAVAIPVGTAVKSSDGTLSFTVVADPANPAWSTAGYFTLGAGLSQVTVAAAAVVPGSAGNVAANTITLLASALPGIDTVFNSVGFSSGLDAEGDVAFRNRFILFINSRALATRIALLSAIQSVQQGLQVAILENTDTTGGAVPGAFLLAVGTSDGNLPPALMSDVVAAVEAVRPIGSRYGIQAPVVVPINVSFSLIMVPGASAASVIPAITASLTGWISGVSIGGTVAVSRLESLIHACSAMILSVQNMQLNGSAQDIQGSWNEIFTVASITGA